jgi:hypothetical protein
MKGFRMPNPPAWIDITTHDPERTRAFYEDLFGWRTQFIPAMNYRLIRPEGGHLPGGIGAAEAENPSGVLIYFAVNNLDDTLRQADRLGTRCVRPPWSIPAMGTMAVIEDPDGNRIGLWQQPPHDETDAGSPRDE